MYFHNSLIPSVTYLFLPHERKLKVNLRKNCVKCVLGVKVNQFRVEIAHVKMGTTPFKNWQTFKGKSTEYNVLIPFSIQTITLQSEYGFELHTCRTLEVPPSGCSCGTRIFFMGNQLGKMHFWWGWGGGHKSNKIAKMADFWPFPPLMGEGASGGRASD